MDETKSKPRPLYTDTERGIMADAMRQIAGVSGTEGAERLNELANSFELGHRRQTPVIVVVGEGRWGRGSTMEEAYKRFRKEGGRKSDRHLVYVCPPDTQIDGHGSFLTERGDVIRPTIIHEKE